jgi:hypothetical protein
VVVEAFSAVPRRPAAAPIAISVIPMGTAVAVTPVGPATLIVVSVVLPPVSTRRPGVPTRLPGDYSRLKNDHADCAGRTDQGPVSLCLTRCLLSRERALALHGEFPGRADVVSCRLRHSGPPDVGPGIRAAGWLGPADVCHIHGGCEQDARAYHRYHEHKAGENPYKRHNAPAGTAQPCVLLTVHPAGRYVNHKGRICHPIGNL